MPGVTNAHRDVVVVGAGWTGLISAKTYLDLAPETDLVILDGGNSVGGVWSKERLYPDLFAQVSHPLFQYSFCGMPKEGLSKDGYVSGYTINRYLEKFVTDYNLSTRVQLNSTVTEVTRAESGAWVLEMDHGPIIECDKLIWAVGPASSSVLPTWPRKEFSSPVIHSAEIGTNLGVIDSVQSAVVVGGAKSAFDTAYLLLKAGKKVDWVIREDGAGPLAHLDDSMAPPTLLGIWNIVDVISTRALACFSPSIMNTSGTCYEMIHQTRLGRWTANQFWRLVTFLADRAAGYSTDENFERLRPTPHGSGVFWARGGLGTASAPDFWQTLHNGELTVHRAVITSLSHTDVVNLSNGISVQADLVIGCTGFEKPYRPFGQSLREELGLSYGASDAAKWRELEAAGDKIVTKALPFLSEYRPPLGPAHTEPASLHGPSRHYRRLVPTNMAARGDRSICFPGVVHVIFTPTVCEFQAVWTAAYMLGRLELPTEEEMELEAATFNVWTRMRYLEMGHKHSFCIYDYLSYIDTLARDLGVNPRRKSNGFAELFVRYKPSDYQGLMDEFLRAQERKSLSSKHQADKVISGL